MIILVAVFLYLAVGITASRLYDKRDIANTISVSSIIDRNLDFSNSNGLTEYLFNTTIQNSIAYAGWWYWRRKKPFSHLPMWINEIIGILFWPVDIMMCEIGHQKELDYLQSIFPAEMKGATK